MDTVTLLKTFLFRSKNVFNIFEDGIHFIYSICISPHTVDEDTKRHEFILNIILCSVIPLLIILDGFIGIATIHDGLSYRGFSFLNFSCIVLVFIYLLLLSRNGYYKFASYALLIIYFTATTYGAIYWGVELPLVSISYIVIIVISGILISTRFAFLVSITSAATIIAVTSLQTHNLIQPQLYWKYTPVRIQDPIELSVIFLLITAISWLSNKEMERSLKRARSSEKALLEERDLLEIKVQERTNELREMQKDKVAQLYRFAEFGKLSSGAFHDLMNSLNVVVSNMERLEHNTSHLPEAKTYVARAVTTSKRIGNYVSAVRKQISNNDLLSYFSVEKEITDAIDILHFKAREASVHITVNMKDDIIMYGNAVQFYQIILNLLGNAIDACEEVVQGLIEITATYNTDKNATVVTIQDNGCGIDSQTLHNIFDTFFTTKPYGKGIGLGLSHTKEMIERTFHGTIIVESEKDSGTTFTITIPLIKHNETSPATYS